MAKRMKNLVRNAAKMTPEERNLQRQSFTYGNLHIENPRITRSIVADTARHIPSPKRCK